MRLTPNIRYFWEGSWLPGRIEAQRRLYDVEIVYCSQGQFTLDIAGQRHSMSRGGLAVIPPNVWHETRTGGTQEIWRHCLHLDWEDEDAPESRLLQCFVGDCFDADRIAAIPPAVSMHLPIVCHLEGTDPLVSLIETILGHLRARELMGAYLLVPLLATLIDRQRGTRNRLSMNRQVPQGVVAVRDYIEKHYMEPQNYDTYSALTRLSGSQLCEAFKKLTGRPPLTYLNDLRLSQACRLLKESKHSVKEISTQVGIPDANYFARMFRKRYRCSPGRFRRTE